jgi:DNA-binding response OmpR family regulator
MKEEIKRRLLVVEDDEPLAHLLKLQLEDEGFEVHTENRGKSAMHYASKNPVDLVILDLRLPDVSGYEVCREIRKIYNPWAVPVLMLTAMNEPIDQLRGFAHGADAYLTKPCEPAELMKTIGLLL